MLASAAQGPSKMKSTLRVSKGASVVPIPAALADQLGPWRVVQVARIGLSLGDERGVARHIACALVWPHASLSLVPISRARMSTGWKRRDYSVSPAGISVQALLRPSRLRASAERRIECKA